MRSVFLVQHLHLISEDKEDIKIIGIYDSRDEAMNAITRLINQPGFSNLPTLVEPVHDYDEEGFYIDEYVLNNDHWAEGFETV